MTLYDQIIAVYPELAESDEFFNPRDGAILLQNDADEFGDYISKWEYTKPVPESLTQFVR